MTNQASTVPRRRGGSTNPPSAKYSWQSWVAGYLMWILVLPLYIGLWAFARVFKRVPNWLLRRLIRSHGRTTARKPDIRIPADMTIPPYMLRWWKIKRNAFFNIYYHNVRRSDDDRALHDHPWWNFSIVLVGSYFEHCIKEGGVHTRTKYEPGAVRFRSSGKLAHRLELERWPDSYPDHIAGMEKPVFTIFITGPVLRRWGFHHQTRWVDAYEWDQFLADNGIENTMHMAGYAEQLQKGQ